MRSLLLTEQEYQTLQMFLLITTNYRNGEQESCARLATETDNDGALTFPKMANNALWWQGCIDTIDAITDKMGVRGGGLPLDVAEAGMCGRYRNMLDDVRAGLAKSTIMQERAFYDGMLQMLELLGGHCKVSEYGSHTISFADVPMQQETTTDPAGSQQSQACALTYGATNLDDTLFCAAQHIKAYHDQCCDKELAAWGKPCSQCDRFPQCEINDGLNRISKFCSKQGVHMQLSRKPV